MTDALNALSALSESDRQAALASLPNEQAQALLWDWRFWARPEQLAPDGDWRTWLILAGRGWGKTRAIAEWIRESVEIRNCRRVAIVGATAADVRDVIVEGESGILAISPPWNRPTYEPSKRRLTWPNGAVATCYSADEPERLRGPQHDAAACDEIATWRYPEAFDMLQLGLRLGADPKCAIATTPKPKRIIRELVDDPTCTVTTGSTYENVANLSPAFVAQIKRRYEGTTLGAQEIHAKLLVESPGALWSHLLLDTTRVAKAPDDLVRVVVGVDPAVTSSKDSDETGIIVAALAESGHCYVLADRSLRASPDTWGKRAVEAFHTFNADRLIAEANNGGDLVETVLRTIDPNLSYKRIHAAKGKYARAEPIAALYEQGKVHHVGSFTQLEDQMTNWIPGESDISPDRMDALVWAITELCLGQDRTVSQIMYRTPRTVLKSHRDGLTLIGERYIDQL